MLGVSGAGGDGLQGADGAVGWDNAGPQSAVAWHACPQLLRHSHTPKLRSTSPSLKVSQDNALQEMGATQADLMEMAKTCFNCTAWSATGTSITVHPRSLPASHSSSRRKILKSLGVPCLQHQPACSCTCSGSVSHAVESGRPTSPT